MESEFDENTRFRLSFKWSLTQRRAKRIVGPPICLLGVLSPFLDPRLLPVLQERNHIGHLPKPIRDASSHRRRAPESLVDTDEVALHEVQRDRRNMMVDAF